MVPAYRANSFTIHILLSTVLSVVYPTSKLDTLEAIEIVQQIRALAMLLEN